MIDKMENWQEQNGSFLERAKKRFQDKAKLIASNKEKVRELLGKVSEKMQRVANIPAIQASKDKIDVLFRMVRAHFRHEYSGFSSKTLILLVLGLVYFIMPIDIIPDFIVGLGYIDDLSVLLAVYKSLEHDIEQFLDWEKSQV